MIVTVLWEDQRGVAAKGFAPHELLLACLADDLEIDRESLKRSVESHPQKGVGNVRRSLERNILRLTKSGPVIAVVDRDQIHALWPPKPPPPSCMSGVMARFRRDTPGAYDLVFLVRNMETLIDCTCRAIGRGSPPGKPSPDQRDQLLMPAVWGVSSVRHTIRETCPSFDRIVKRVRHHLELHSRPRG